MESERKLATACSVDPSRPVDRCTRDLRGAVACGLMRSPVRSGVRRPEALKAHARPSTGSLDGQVNRPAGRGGSEIPPPPAQLGSGGTQLVGIRWPVVDQPAECSETPPRFEAASGHPPSTAVGSSAGPDPGEQADGCRRVQARSSTLERVPAPRWRRARCRRRSPHHNARSS